mgnify:CR=1 FL=1
MRFFNRFYQYFSQRLPPSVMKAVGQVFGAQLLFQVMGFGISLVLVRAFTKSEYAIYTVLMAVFGMLNITANSGVMTGFKKIGSENWHNPTNLAVLVKTTLGLRKYLVGIAFITIGAYAFVLLNKQDLPVLEILFFLTGVFLFAWPEADMLVLREAILLKRKFVTVQSTFLLNQSIRLVLILTLFLFFKSHLTINVILGVTIIATWISFHFLKSRAVRILPYPEVKIDAGYRKTLLKYVKLNWHNSVFYAFKEQISIFFLGLFGSSDTLAELGALTRFSLLFLGISAIMNNLVGPSFGRTKSRPALIVIIKKTAALLIAVAIVTLIIGSFFADELLWVLGDAYAGLQYELILILVLSLVNLSSAGIIALNNAKGWITYSPKFEIPLNIISILMGAFIFDISTVAGTVYLAILASSVTLLLYIANLVYGLNHSRNIN